MEPDTPTTWATIRLFASGLVAFACAAGVGLVAAFGYEHVTFADAGQTQGTVTSMVSESLDVGLFKSRRILWRTEYTFAGADGATRSGSDLIPTPSEVRVGMTIPVWYTPDGRSRVADGPTPPGLWPARLFYAAVGSAVVALLVFVWTAYRRWWGRDRSEMYGPGEGHNGRTIDARL